MDTSATYINLIVDLLDEEDKKRDLLTAWNSFKIEVCFSSMSHPAPEVGG